MNKTVGEEKWRKQEGKEEIRKQAQRSGQKPAPWSEQNRGICAQTN